jgi:HTH-type transcriptional regulator/antitoxin HigA
VLAILLEEYEAQLYTFGTPDPVDAILFRMEQQGLSARDLMPFLGSEKMVANVLSRKEPLTLEMIRALHVGLGLSANILIREYSATPT